MYQIAILGCGQIGSRHLQSLARLEHPARIHLVDPSRESLALCELRFAEVITEERKNFISLVLHSDCQCLPSKLDAAIIASASMHRAQLCHDLLAVSQPRFLLLEKFLFPRVVDYAEIENLLLERKIPSYVNQWFGVIPSLHKILNRLEIVIHETEHRFKIESPVLMRVHGSGWGLCCNAVHYLELFEKLTDAGIIRLNNTQFLPGRVESRRKGYYEIFGSMSFSASDGSILELECTEGLHADSIGIEIQHKGHSVSIQYFIDRFECEFKKEGKCWTENLPIPRQSELTHLILEEFFQTGNCRLPTLSTSCSQHLLVLNPFLDHFRLYDSRIGESCPIT